MKCSEDLTCCFHPYPAFQEGGLCGGGGRLCARGGCQVWLCLQSLGSAWVPRGWRACCMLRRPLLHALTQQEHRPGAPRLACQGLPNWPGPSQAAVPCQAGAEHLHRVPHASPHRPWPFRLSGQQATGTSVPSLEPLAGVLTGSPFVLPSVEASASQENLSKAAWVTRTSPFPSVKWSYQTGRLLQPRVHSGEGQRLGPFPRQKSDRPRLGFATTSLPGDPRLEAALSGHPNTCFPALDPGRRPPCSPLWAAAEAAVSRQLGRPGRAPEARSGLKCAPGRAGGGRGSSLVGSVSSSLSA